MRLSFKPYKQHINDLLLIIIVVGCGFVLGQILTILIVKIIDPTFFQDIEMIKESNNSNRIYILKLIQFVSAFCTFVLPPFVISKLISKKSTDYLKLNNSPDIAYYFLIVVFMISIMPLMNIIINFNENVSFPEWLSGLEERLRVSEDSSQSMVMLIISGERYIDLIVNLVIIALLPAIGEELLFRGVIQKYFTDTLKNPHLAIILSALIFSAIHFQFFGFIPRFILGAFFGYLVYYSKSMWPAIWAHFFNNALAVIAMFYIARGELSEDIENIGTQSPDTIYVIAGLFFAVIVGYLMFNKNANEKFKLN